MPEYVKNDNRMGKWGATSYIIGNIVGSGIFITPGAIIQNSSSIGVALLIWIISAIIAILGSFCYIELGTSIRRSGADYAYLCYVKWVSVAFAFMSCGCIMSNPMTLAIQAEALGKYVIRTFEIKICQEWNDYATKLCGFFVVWSLLYLNFFSLRNFVAKFQIVASIAKILSSLIIIGIGLYWLIFKENAIKNLLNPFNGTKLDSKNLTIAFSDGLFSYDGWDVLNFGNEDVANPKAVMPFAILFGMSIVTFIFLAMNISYVIVLSLTQIQESDEIAVTLSEVALGNFRYIIPFCIAIVLIGSLNVTMFSSSRYLYVAARSGKFPTLVSCLNEKQDSPRAALLIHVLFAIAFSLIANLNELIGYVTFALFTQRFLTVVALVYIRLCHVPVHPEAIHVPLIIPILYLILTGSLIVVTVVMNPRTIYIAGGVVTIGFIIYALFFWEKTLQRSSTFRKISYYINHKTCMAVQIVLNGLVNLECESFDEDELPIPDKFVEIDQLANNTGLRLRKQIHPIDN